MSVDATLSRLDIHLTGDSPVTRFSREAERQADIVATQIMVDAGFDPQALTHMMQRMKSELSNRTVAYFNSHPDLANRAARVRDEAQKMGGAKNTRGDSPDFHSIQDHLVASADNPDRTYEVGRSSSTVVDTPSTRLITHREGDIQFRFPDNWSVYDDQDGISIAPEGGIVSGSLAYGMKIATFTPPNGRPFQNGLNSTIDRTGRTLSRVTDQLVDQIRQSNPDMRMVGSEQRRTVDGQSAVVRTFNNDSATGGTEVNWLVSVSGTDGTLRYFIGVAPRRDFNRYASTFDQIVGSVRFIR